MTANLGNADRILRAVLGVLLIIAPLLNVPAIWSSSALAYGSMIVGLILLATSMFRFCPLYRVFGISTCRM